MKQIIHLFFSLLILANCFSQSEIFGLASPIVLELDTTVVYLEDYFADVSVIQNIVAPDGFEKQLSADKKLLTLIAPHSIPFLSELQIITAQDAYSILLRKSKKEKIIFSFDPKGNTYSKVSIVGDLSGWNPNVIFMENKNGVWQTELILNPGRYQYQIVADGNWFLDPNNPEKIDNGIGGFNSLMRVGEVNRSILPLIRTAKVKKMDIVNNLNSVALNFIEYDGVPVNEYFTFWNNKRISENNYTLTFSEELNFQAVFVIPIPVEAISIKRSYFRAYCYNEFGESNDILIPLEYGKVITDPSLLEKDDFQKTIMYFMMVDRFNNGNKMNDNPVLDARVLPQANYYGGDLEGIQQKINEGYFQAMGFNALWVSPIFQNPYVAYQEFPEPHRWFSGYHGYWPISLSKVDTRFGDNNLFKKLVASAHENNMSIYLDYVANHIHAEHPLWQQHPEWFSKLDLPDGRKNLRLWDEQRLTTWFEPYMPSFDHSQPIVAEACADSAMYWLKEFNIDGFRHDATKHIETEFWRLLTQKIKTEVEIPQNRNIYQIGETFGSRELIASYIGTGLLNAQFDFDLYFDARSVFANDDVSFARLSASLNETFDYFGYHHVMGNITGNHDMARFISYASGDLEWDENDKEVGWQRKIEVTDTTGYAKLKMLHAFNMTIPGIPIVYYGDEIGMPGANDPDNRRMMRFDSLDKFEQDVKNTVTQLAKFRSQHMALLYGDFEIVRADDEVLIYRRTYFDDIIYVVFNKSNREQSADISLNEETKNYKIKPTFGSIGFVDTVSISPNTDPGIYYFYEINMTPYSFEIITFEK
ncbi:MAG: alpha-amylase family glycosyl hydrolase [Chitinophagales bacterium]